VFVNKLVNARTGEERGPTHRLWAHGSTGYVWQPEANCPVFDEFLESVFPDDDDAKRLVEEWLGYNMTEDVWAQKGMTLIEEPRAGKGLIIHMMEGLVGSRNFVALDFDSWQKNGFSTQCMLGKRAGAFPDVRMKPGQYYGNEWVPGGLDHKARELLLKITGGDHLTIEKKWKTEAWEGVLPLKLTLVSNEIPNFNEDILASRFLKLHFKRSFLGKEDVNL
jgi:putative DNA primase/helicase